MLDRRMVALVSLAVLVAISRPAHGSNCAGTSTGFVPLTDLGSGTYHGFPGGLYGAGSNVRPATHEFHGIDIANALVPLDTLGHPDPNGSIVFVSIGMSNCTQEFSTFIPIANADPQKNPRVKLIDCAVGGQSADVIRNPAAAYWDSVRTRLRGHGSSPAQVQVVWSKEANRQPTGTFPASADSLTWNMGAVVRNITAFMPNTKLAYLTSRIYAGYASSTLNPEPYAYESGFAFKWLIDAQIAGVDSLNYDPDVGTVHAPWLSWGPYLWADGTTPRSDGLTWACSDFVSTDGTHPSSDGRAKVADSLLAFLKRDVTTVPWFLRHTTSVPGADAGSLEFSIAPNPSHGSLALEFTPPAAARWKIDLVDLAGRRVALVAHGVGSGAREAVRWTAPRALRTGTYWVRYSDGRQTRASRFALIAH